MEILALIFLPLANHESLALRKHAHNCNCATSASFDAGSRATSKTEEPEEASCSCEALFKVSDQEGKGRLLLGLKPSRWPANLLQALLLHHVQGETSEKKDLAHVDVFPLLTDVFLELLTGSLILFLSAVCMSKAEVRCSASDNVCKFFYQMCKSRNHPQPSVWDTLPA